MDLKRLITHFTYRIEPKPGGGFIAHATDPAAPPLEAATREELQRKIQANITAALTAEFPGLKIPTDNRELKFAFHVERTPQGGFAIHSADSDGKPVEGATHDEIESHFLEKLVGFVGKHFMPELSQALAAQGNSSDIKIFVNRKTSFATKTSSGQLNLGAEESVPEVAWSRSDTVQLDDAKPTDRKITNAIYGSSGEIVGNSPITPETSGSWALLRFLMTILIVALLMYFFLHRH
jgi:hypothetical protein